MNAKGKHEVNTIRDIIYMFCDCRKLVMSIVQLWPHIQTFGHVQYFGLQYYICNIFDTFVIFCKSLQYFVIYLSLLF